MKRTLFVALALGLVAGLVSGCKTTPAGTSGAGTPAGGTGAATGPRVTTPANMAIANAINGKWVSTSDYASVSAVDANGKPPADYTFSIEWKLTDGKGTVTYSEDFGDGNPAGGTADVDVAVNGADFQWPDAKGTLHAVRIRYVGNGVLEAERVAIKTPGLIIGSEVYARTMADSKKLWANLTQVGSLGSGYTEPGQPSYYDNLLKQGVLVQSANLIGK